MTVPGIAAFLARSLLSGLEVRFDEHRVSRNARVALEMIKRTGWGGKFLPAGLALNLKDEKVYARTTTGPMTCRRRSSSFAGRECPMNHSGSGYDKELPVIIPRSPRHIHHMALKRISETTGSVNELHLEGDFANHILRG